MHRVPVCKVHSGTVVDLRVAPVRKFQRTGHVILVPVRFENMSDNRLVPVCTIETGIAVPPGSMTAACPPDPTR